jgi:competence protein ComEA
MQMPDISRRRALAYAVVVLAVVALAGRLLAPAPPRTTDAAPALPRLEAAPESPQKVVVHVVGAVERPGLYRLDEGSRVDDAIRRAGGATRRASLASVNLASPVADGQQIVVPPRAPAAGAGAMSGSSAVGDAGAVGAAPAAPAERVHLNSATIEQLDALPGVGPVTAQNIIDYRTENGAFGSVEELDAVPGIGPARLEQLKELVDL